MYYTYNKTTYRLLGSSINGLIMAVFGIYAIGWTIMALVALFTGKSDTILLIPLILIWLEFFFTARTFSKGVTTGPNSALWNLPLLYIDFCLVIFVSNTLLLFVDIYGFGDFYRTLMFVFVILRYIGLAWTTPSFFLKRLICPIREDKSVEAAMSF